MIGIVSCLTYLVDEHVVILVSLWCINMHGRLLIVGCRGETKVLDRARAELVTSRIANALVNFVVEQEMKSWQFLLVMSLLMLALGMFFKVFAVILINVSLVLSLLDSLGINTIHYAVVVTVNMELVLISLLIGLNLMCCHLFQKRRLAP